MFKYVYNIFELYIMSLPEIPRILWNFWINFADDKTEISEIDESVEVSEDDPPSNNIDKLPDYVD